MKIVKKNKFILKDKHRRNAVECAIC